ACSEDAAPLHLRVGPCWRCWAAFSLQQQMEERVDLAFITLMRLANRRADVLRYMLFRHPRCASNQFKDLCAGVQKPRVLDQMHPLVDREALLRAFSDHHPGFAFCAGDTLRATMACAMSLSTGRAASRRGFR